MEKTMSYAYSFNLPPWVVILAMIFGFFLFRYLLRVLGQLRCLEVKARVSKVCRGGMVQLDSGEMDQVAVGQVFTLYKGLKFGEVWQEGKKPRTKYAAVGRIEVISTTQKSALGKFRAIRGYSYNPRPGDRAFYRS